MTYTGNVTPGGPADVRDLGPLTITKLAVCDETSNNAYLLTCRSTGEQLLVDAADDAPRLLEMIGDGGLNSIVTTHQHWDHHRALAEVVAATGAPVAAGADDADAITEQTGVSLERRLVDGDTVTVGDCVLDVIHLVGHTPGSVALLWTDPTEGAEFSAHLFTGDSLFPGGVGNTRGDAANFASLIDDVESKIFDRLGDDVWFYPGHGADSTLGAQRAAIPEWRDRGW